GNINAVEKTVKRLVAELKSKIGLSSDNVRQIFNQLVGDTVIKYLTDSDIDMSHIFGSNFNIYNELSKKETLEDIEQWLVDIYKKMFDYLNRHVSDDDKINKIMGYIQMNYKKDIGIQDIADYVGLSYSHVRKVFKDKIGKNIGDVINSLRMN
ncbi:MAG TPA: AraC family transcriptional regulator, partial [Ruminiclostridium sp.]|nr:AraC family transcriptional regulator [Ruminiclostridium sp.]